MIISLPNSSYDNDIIRMTVDDTKLLAEYLQEMIDEANDHDVYLALINFGYSTKLSVKVTKSQAL